MIRNDVDKSHTKGNVFRMVGFGILALACAMCTWGCVETEEDKTYKDVLKRLEEKLDRYDALKDKMDGVDKRLVKLKESVEVLAKKIDDLQSGKMENELKKINSQLYHLKQYRKTNPSGPHEPEVVKLTPNDPKHIIFNQVLVAVQKPSKRGATFVLSFPNGKQKAFKINTGSREVVSVLGDIYFFDLLMSSDFETTISVTLKQ